MLTMFFSSLNLKIGTNGTQDVSSSLVSVVFTVFLLSVNFKRYHFYIYIKVALSEIVKENYQHGGSIA
jgi:hypothetical protein